MKNIFKKFLLYFSVRYREQERQKLLVEISQASHRRDFEYALQLGEQLKNLR